jgi:predicted nucleotidyltransferase
VALLFGSEARGAARVDSDVDVAIEAPLVDVLDLASMLSEALEREVDVVRLEEATIPLLEQIVRDGIVVHEGYRGAGALWRSAASLCRAVGLRENVVGSVEPQKILVNLASLLADQGE